jgi:hypothetical protein
LVAILISELKFNINGAITALERNIYFYVDPAEENEKTLLPRIRNRAYIMFHGLRASSKTTRIMRAIEQLQNEFCCL